MPASAYLDTRVSLFAERLWSHAAFDELIAAPGESVSGLLDRFGLGALASGYVPDAGDADPSSLEQRIIARVLDETRILLRPLDGAAREFLGFWTARFEISNIKTLLRSKLRGEPAATALASLTPMGAFARIDHDALAHVEDVGELLRRLEAGPYAVIVRHARRAFDESHDPFHLDAALDQGYYVGLVQRASRLEPGHPPLARLMADLLDRVNLVWLLRYRFNYGLPPGQVYYLLVDTRYGLSATRLRELAALDSVGAVLGALPETWRRRLDGVADIPGVFVRLEQAAAEQARAVLRQARGGSALARAFAYLSLRERDLRGVRAVLRGRLLGLDADDIRVALRRAEVPA